MDDSSASQGVDIPLVIAVGFGIIGLILIALFISYCCREKSQDGNNNRRLSSSSIESFQQLYFTNTPYNPIQNIDQRTIERWSSVNQPSMTFYRVSMQDNSDNLYQPVTEERLRSTIEQSKAMEYSGLEIVFF